ncbi:ABC transporter substrate-binding protein [Mesorhizobium sp. SB112]|uniref:ABC transporter substrate-binding protein n=1 Tax=Mesorhizobium sp. SB112 TaxID=3151853 RepID=UPI0032665271
MNIKFKLAMGIASIIGSFLAVQPAISQDQLKPVRIIVGTSTLNVSYPQLNLPVALGYWREEGYDVEVVALAPPAQSITLLIAGQADIGQVNASVAVQSRTEHNEPVKIAMMNGVIDWSVAVLGDSPYQSLSDLKGKNVGVFGLGSGGVPLLKSALLAQGIDPEKDVTLIAVGGGAPAAEALRGGRVDALVFWGTAMAGFENAGLNLRYMRGDNWLEYPDFVLTVMEPTLERDPKMVEAIARGAAKATLFASTNPECALKIQWATWPQTKPTGAPNDETAARWDLNLLNRQLDTFQKGYELGGGELYGKILPTTIERFQDYLLSTAQITRTLPGGTWLIDSADYFERVNNFDRDPIVQAAQQCKGY